MKVVVIDTSWSCVQCGRWIKADTVRWSRGRFRLLLADCERDGLIVEPRPNPYRVRIEEDAA